MLTSSFVLLREVEKPLLFLGNPIEVNRSKPKKVAGRSSILCYNVTLFPKGSPTRGLFCE